MKLYIKNMVCIRCKMVVMDELSKLGLHYTMEKLVNHDYTYLSNLFSGVQGVSIERFFISHKVERVKELINYNEFSLREIADKMNYSSVAHLCSQFKKVAGWTPSEFKRVTIPTVICWKTWGVTRKNSKASD